MMYRAFFFSLVCLILALPSHAFIHEEKGSFKLNCGALSGRVNFRTAVDSRNSLENKFAILIEGSPLSEYFSNNFGNFEIIFWSLIANGYKVLELKYPNELIQSPKSGYALGFYAACLHQGLEAVIRHEGELYDAIVKQLHYDSRNSRHELVGFGFSVGAMKLQSMAFTLGKPFNKIGIAGVLLGDVETGSKADLSNFDGMSWASFLNLAKHISSDGLGCTGAEFTSKYNFENQPYFTASDLAMFEGMKTSATGPFAAAANPGQVRYIAQKRLEQGAPTQTFFYKNCDHEVIRCGGQTIATDIVHFLTSGGEPVFDIKRYLKGH